MTYRRRWTYRATHDMAALPGDAARTAIRTATTLLAGNPYPAESYAVEGDIHQRGIVLENGYVVRYAVRPQRVLEIQSVEIHQPE